jgi:hypothetical protein
MPPRTRSRSSRQPQQAPPRTDVYVGLLIIAFLAMVAGTVLLYLDYAAYSEQAPKDPGARPAAAGAQNPGGAQPGGVQPGGPGGPGGPPAGGPGGPAPMPMPMPMPPMP